MFIFFTTIFLSNTDAQPTALRGLTDSPLSLLQPSSGFAYAVPMHTVHISWFLLKNSKFCSSFFMLCHNSLRQHVAIIRNMNLVYRILYFKLQEMRKILLSFRYTVVHKKNPKKSWTDRNTALVHVKKNWYVQGLYWDRIGGGREWNPQPNLGYTRSFIWIIQHNKGTNCFINHSLWQAIIQQKSGKYLNRKDKALPKFCIPKAVSPSATFSGIPELHLVLILSWTTLPHSSWIACRLWDVKTCCHALFSPHVLFRIFFFLSI